MRGLQLHTLSVYNATIPPGTLLMLVWLALITLTHARLLSCSHSAPSCQATRTDHY